MKNLTINNQTIHTFRGVFKSPGGLDVLNFMLADLGYFDEIDIDDREAVVLRNYASRLLRMVGVNAACNTKDMTVKLMSIVPYQFQETQDDPFESGDENV